MEAASQSRLAVGYDQGLGRTERGLVYLVSVIDCCTRDIVGWDLSALPHQKKLWRRSAAPCWRFCLSALVERV